jgi:hypothetical protein
MIEPEELKDAAVEVYDLSHQILCLTEELHDRVIDFDDDDIDADILEEVKETLKAAESMRGVVNRWCAQIIPDEGEDNPAPAPAPAPALP